jgi:outer membrane protein OmpA-like peptidoglycan-associated protein
LNFYEGQINATETNVKRERPFSKTLNTKFHEATLTFTNNRQRVYFTRNNYNGDLRRDDEGVSNLKLYTAVRNDSISDNDWSNIQELPFNSDDYSVGHPTLSADGKKLYFVSDMPGSIGATDIFVVDILEDNTYSLPKNLGPKINTSGREMFPFITERKLYFASDGHLGIGGLDVFESSILEDSFTDPQNLGLPLNSNLDDFGFIINEDNEQGFVCSNREGGVGDDDIYAFRRTKPQVIKDTLVDNCEQSVKGYISNTRTGERISDVTVALYTKDGIKLTQTQSKINGDYAFNFNLDCSERYEVRLEKIGYDPNTKLFVTSSISEETIVPLELKTIDKLIVEDNGQLKIKVGIIFFNTDKSYIRPDAAVELNKIVTLMSQRPDISIRVESHTDSRANDNYNLVLSQRRAESTRDYLIRQGIKSSRIVEAKGFGEAQLMNTCGNGVECEEAQHQLNRRSEFIIVKM